MSGGLYEQIKDDLGYLQLDRAAEVFADARRTSPHRRAGPTSSSSPASSPSKPTADRNRRLAARLRYARFPFRKTIDEFDFEFQPTVDRKLVEDLATLRFIDENRPILFLGQPGCGKTHLAVALATLAVEAGYRGYFTTADDDGRQTIAHATRDGTLTVEAEDLHRPIRARDRRRRAAADRTAPTAPRVLPSRQPPATRSSTPRSSPPTAGCPTGARSSATPSSPPRSSTGSCTTPSCSTSKARPGGYASTTPSRSPPPTPPQRTPPLTSPTGKTTSPANATFADHRTRLSVQPSIAGLRGRVRTFAAIAGSWPAARHASRRMELSVTE